MFTSCTGAGAAQTAGTQAQTAETQAQTAETQAEGGGEVSKDSPFKDLNITFFVGGAEGDMFGTIVYNGAKAAERDLGPKVKYIFSGWDGEKMVQQLRETIAQKPDGISMMGHAGDDALFPLVKEAQEKGIKLTMVNVPCPEIQEKLRTGYVGSYTYEFGYALGKAAIERYGIKAGDKVWIDGEWRLEGSKERALGTAKPFEELGCTIIKNEHTGEHSANPETLLPNIAGALEANPDIKLICIAGGQCGGQTAFYMKSLNKKPGEIKVITYDLSPQIIDSIKQGYLQLTIDQQPYYQGYLPIVSLCNGIVYGLDLITVNTGTGLVDETNYQAAEQYVQQQFR